MLAINWWQTEYREFRPLFQIKRLDTMYQTYAFNMAEQEGFEPSHLLQSTRFPSVPLQPLEYCSVLRS